ncbi:MAG: entericidin [Rhizobiales bacterium 65-79]|jgi:entericidin B|nr:entericidin [Hyphomicrobiales bacterium]OJU03860.1 MAG: entericidin [Rhizobiales bacterium 65-79]
MKLGTVSRLFVVLALTSYVAGCANTIRGAGQDTANAVNAAQHAGKKIDRAAKY